jgi:hypothetical protein
MRATTPKLGIAATSFMTSRTTDDKGAATYSHTDTIGRTGDDDEGHNELTSQRIAGEPPLCQQCHHD